MKYKSAKHIHKELYELKNSIFATAQLAVIKRPLWSSSLEYRNALIKRPLE